MKALFYREYAAIQSGWVYLAAGLTLLLGVSSLMRISAVTQFNLAFGFLTAMEVIAFALGVFALRVMYGHIDSLSSATSEMPMVTAGVLIALIVTLAAAFYAISVQIYRRSLS